MIFIYPLEYNSKESFESLPQIIASNFTENTILLYNLASLVIGYASESLICAEKLEVQI